MTLATTTTQAKAVRKHGGDRARRYLRTLLLRGRPAMPAGGDLKSHCCAAAGITSALPNASRGHAYPTAGVRHAQETGTRSAIPTRPPAQLVEGYKHSRDDYEWPHVIHDTATLMMHASAPCRGHALPLDKEGNQ